MRWRDVDATGGLHTWCTPKQTARALYPTNLHIRTLHPYIARETIDDVVKREEELNPPSTNLSILECRRQHPPETIHTWRGTYRHGGRHGNRDRVSDECGTSNDDQSEKSHGVMIGGRRIKRRSFSEPGTALEASACMLHRQLYRYEMRPGRDQGYITLSERHPSPT